MKNLTCILALILFALFISACSDVKGVNSKITNEMLQAAAKVNDPVDSVVFVAAHDNGFYHEDPFCINLSNRTGLLSGILKEDAVKLGLIKCTACWYRKDEYIDNWLYNRCMNKN